MQLRGIGENLRKNFNSLSESEQDPEGALEARGHVHEIQARLKVDHGYLSEVPS